jgi:rod shape-determining protein MreD
MRPALALLAVSGGGTVVQSTLSPLLGLGGAVPDVPMVLVVLLSVHRGPEAGCLAGFLLGLAQDGLAGGPLGLHALSKAVLGFAGGELPRVLLARRPAVTVALAALATLADGALRFGVLQLFQYPAPFGELFLRVMVPQAVLNGALTAALLALSTAWPQIRWSLRSGA